MKKFILKLGEKVRKLIPQDKALHLLAGGIIAFILSLVLFALQAPFPVGITHSLVGTFLVGTFKECYIDYKWKNENPEFGDIVATTLGGILIAVVQVVMFYLAPHIVVY